jgi:hypothetical protein
MMRKIGAVIAASLAAPSLAMLFGTLSALLFDPTSADFNLDSLSIGLVAFGIAILFVFLFASPLALVLALTAAYFDVQKRWIHVMGSALVGLLFSLFVFGGLIFPSQPQIHPLSLAIGSICGWIYWRIALAAQ